MVQSPSWEADCFAASQEIPHISRSPKVHYRTHKRPPPVSTLGQPNPVHISTSHILEIHSNIIHTSTPRSPQLSPSLRFPHQDSIHPLSSLIRATCPAHPRSRNHLAARYAISSIPPLPRPWTVYTHIVTVLLEYWSFLSKDQFCMINISLL
jgi:hypothetical protein